MFSIICLFASTLVFHPAPGLGGIGLYETWEIKIENDREYINAFNFEEIELKAELTSPSGKSFSVDGFYDGNGLGGQIGRSWKLRFMPNESGRWMYEYGWSDGQEGGKGDFLVLGRKEPENHGHVHVDRTNPQYLIHDDGTPHYWWGANWIAADICISHNLNRKMSASNDVKEKILRYFDILQKYKHNGLLLKTALFFLKDDKFSWNLDGIHCVEWLVREMGKRGIYAQINFFDTWSREINQSTYNIDGSKHVFNVWESGNEKAKLNYIRTITARFAGFYNVYWELGNEMEHSPNSAKDFIRQANSKYIPWIRENDPYNLPIGLSEEIWKRCDVDIGFMHQPAVLLKQAESRSAKNIKAIVKSIFKRNEHEKPVIMNELVRGGISEKLWKDSTIRDSANRIAYRMTFWMMFVRGGSGSSEASWLDFSKPLNNAVLNVMADQQRLRKFMESLPVNFNEMKTDNDFVVSGPGSFRTRSKKNTLYVSYFLLSPNEMVQKGVVRVNLPKGTYELVWYNPRKGNYSETTRVISDGGAQAIHHPEFEEDIVLKVMKDRPYGKGMNANEPG